MASPRPVIVEGPDGGGKTRLATALADLYGLEYRRPSNEDLSSSSGPIGTGLVEWWDEQLALGDKALRRGIYDRCFYISDPIYQQAQPDRELLTPSGLLASGIMKLWNIEPILIFCLPPFEVQLTNVRANGRDRLAGVDDNALEKISNAYWATYAHWSNGLSDHTTTYDYTQPSSLDDLLEELLDLGCEEVQ